MLFVMKKDALQGMLAAEQCVRLKHFFEQVGLVAEGPLGWKRVAHQLGALTQ